MMKISEQRHKNSSEGAGLAGPAPEGLLMRKGGSVGGTPGVALLRWNYFFFRDAPPHVMSIFRIAFGSFLLLYWGLKWPHVPMIFSEQGIAMPLQTWLPLGLGTVPAVEVSWALFAVFFLVLLTLTLGILPRLSAALAFVFTLYYWNLSLHIFGTSFDQLFLLILLVLAFSSTDAWLSPRMYFKRGSVFAWEPICILPQRLLALQITATYLGVGWQKIYLPSWQNGRILLQGFTGRWATPVAYMVARVTPLWVYDVMTMITVYFEFLIPFGLWIRHYRIRWFFFLGGAIFHTSIWIFLNIWWFMVLIPAYILFFEPEEVEKCFRRFPPTS